MVESRTRGRRTRAGIIGSVTDLETLRAELPLLTATPTSWAKLAATHLDRFLADHAVCRQQAALVGALIEARSCERFSTLLVQRETEPSM